jgi:hypothetical protein
MHQDREIHHHLGEHNNEFHCRASDGTTQLFSQQELNDLLHDLNLPKDTAEVLGSRLKVENLLSAEANFSWYKHHEQDLASYFSEEGSMMLLQKHQWTDQLVWCTLQRF